MKSRNASGCSRKQNDRGNSSATYNTTTKDLKEFVIFFVSLFFLFNGLGWGGSSDSILFLSRICECLHRLNCLGEQKIFSLAL